MGGKPKNIKLLQQLVTSFALTDEGLAMLNFADRNSILIEVGGRFSEITPATYSADPKLRDVVFEPGEIALDMREKMPILIGSLAHELFHAWQHSTLGNNFFFYSLPPAHVVMLNRFLEISAYLFQANFMLDYAAKTGDRSVLEVESSHMLGDIMTPKLLDLPNGRASVADNIAAWAEDLFPEVSISYDYETLRKTEKHLDAPTQYMPHNPRMSLTESWKLVAAVCNRIDRLHPFTRPGSDKDDHYFGRLTTSELAVNEEAFYISNRLLKRYNRVSEKYDATRKSFVAAKAVKRAQWQP